MSDKEQNIRSEVDLADPGTGRGNADMATQEPKGATVTNANVIKVSAKA